MSGCEVYLKLESLQMGGSFKVRGATYKIQTHFKEVQGKGVVAASVGNHVQGVAIAARAAGIPARVFMPTWALPFQAGGYQELWCRGGTGGQ